MYDTIRSVHGLVSLELLLCQGTIRLGESMKVHSAWSCEDDAYSAGAIELPLSSPQDLSPSQP